LRHDPAVAIGGTGLAQLYLPARDQVFQRGLGSAAGFRPFPGFARRRRERDLDAGEADFPPIIEDKAAAIGDRPDFPTADAFEPAGGRRMAFRAGACHWQGDQARKDQARKGLARKDNTCHADKPI
jgi:hypothetical protein